MLILEEKMFFEDMCCLDDGGVCGGACVDGSFRVRVEDVGMFILISEIEGDFFR